MTVDVGKYKIVKDVWSRDRVKIISGKFAGCEGVVISLEEVRTKDTRYVKYVRVKLDGRPRSRVRIHVKNIHVTEMDSDHRSKREFEARRAAKITESKASRQSR